MAEETGHGAYVMKPPPITPAPPRNGLEGTTPGTLCLRPCFGLRNARRPPMRFLGALHPLVVVVLVLVVVSPPLFALSGPSFPLLPFGLLLARPPRRAAHVLCRFAPLPSLFVLSLLPCMFPAVGAPGLGCALPMLSLPVWLLALLLTVLFFAALI